jgi:malonate-semialdehyde dehydrogenase (acetylating) / methylmalonate-semialdehyde dehydrogenase
MSYHVTHYINGQYVLDNKRLSNITNPATGLTIGHVAMADQAIVERAIAAAKSAFPAWSATPPSRRVQILFNFKTLLEKHKNELATLITQEHGKTYQDAQGSIQRGIDSVDFACGLPYLLKGSYAENVASDIDSYSLRQALGVCVGITPFNFPAMIPLWMFPMAIACGNTFVLKPSEKDPSCAIRLAELAQQAGLPDGVLNIVQGDKEAVDILLKHNDVNAVSFVGSTPVAQYVYQTATAHGKRCQAFGGAKNHALIMPDADLEHVLDALIGAAYGSAGERCMAISVVLVIGDDLANQLVDKLKHRIAKLNIGPGNLPNIEMGPLISQSHWERVKNFIDMGVKEGARLVVDGRSYKPKGYEKGFFMGGCLFDYVSPHMQIYRQEIFGPVLSVVRVQDFASALQMINTHEFGNGTAIFTQDGHTAQTFASQVQVGMVGINVPIPVPVPYQNFGGWKHSMFGDIPMHGVEGLNFYTKIKVVTARWLRGKKSQTDFTISTLKS